MFTVPKKMMVVAMAALMVAMVPIAAVRADERPNPQLQQQQEQEQYLEAVANVAADRDAFIAGLVSQWKPVAVSLKYKADKWEQEFISLLTTATPEKLLAIQGASDYDAVRAILQGVPVAVDGDGLSIQNLGDTNNDLTFTALNPPCRFIDTRNFYGYPGTYPKIPALQTLSYYVYGSSTQIGYYQGGNPAGCTSPKGEPAAVAINLAAVQPASASHLRMWPYAATMPEVSYLNYNTGQNVANAGIITNCYGCGPDVSIYNGSVTHYIADTMGFFYPVSQSDPSFNEVRNVAGVSGGVNNSPLLSDFVWRFIGPTVQLSVNAGDRIHVVANQAVGTTTAASSLDIAACFRLNGSSAEPTRLPGNGLEIWGLQMTSTNRIPVNASGVASFGGSGVYNFGLCYRTTSGNWNNNEWGTVTATQLNF